jgi:hypothetical protein
MRFGNSSDYFGLESNLRHPMVPNSATGKAFHAIDKRISGTVTTLMPRAGFSTAANSAVTICSKVTTDDVGTAAPFDFAQGRLSAVQAWAKPGASSRLLLND